MIIDTHRVLFLNIHVHNLVYILNATANATLFKVLFLGNGLRYLFEILDFEVWRLFALRNDKIIHP